jgi:hypothetical protein
MTAAQSNNLQVLQLAAPGGGDASPHHANRGLCIAGNRKQMELPHTNPSASGRGAAMVAAAPNSARWRLQMSAFETNE